MPQGLIESPDSTVNDPPAWYAVYTRHQHEKTVAQVLLSKGFGIFLPLYEAPHRWKDRTKVLYLPLFPCYVFLQGDLGRRLDILTAPGIHAIVSYAGQPAAIPPAEIECLRRIVASGLSVEPHPFLKCGETVRVKSGYLAGVEGILVRKRNLYRLVLSVEMLGKAASVEVDACLVERINGDRPGPRSVDRKVVSTHTSTTQKYRAV